MKYLKIMSVLFLAVTMINCSKDDEAKKPVADFTFQVNELEVVFNGSATDAKTYMWDFGDGETSTEMAPTHVYDTPDSYTVTFTAKGDGGEDSQTKEVEATATFEYLLTGGSAAENGKTWVLDYKVHVGDDGIGGVTNSLALLQPIDEDGFMEYISLPQAYKDEFTFKNDGSYMVNNSDTYGGSITSMIYAQVSGNYDLTGADVGGDVIALSSEMALAPFGDLIYSPKTDAKWSMSTEDFTIQAISLVDNQVGDVTFTNKKRLMTGEYFGLKGFDAEVMVKSITETHMNVAITLRLEATATDYPTHLVHLTFIAK